MNNRVLIKENNKTIKAFINCSLSVTVDNEFSLLKIDNELFNVDVKSIPQLNKIIESNIDLILIKKDEFYEISYDLENI